jgi:hypothetical protein
MALCSSEAATVAAGEEAAEVITTGGLAHKVITTGGLADAIADDTNLKL